MHPRSCHCRSSGVTPRWPNIFEYFACARYPRSPGFARSKKVDAHQRQGQGLRPDRGDLQDRGRGGQNHTEMTRPRSNLLTVKDGQVSARPNLREQEITEEAERQRPSVSSFISRSRKEYGQTHSRSLRI